MSASRTTARVQGVLFALGGTWSIVHRPSFEAVTGRKVDYWLVQTVGLLLTTIGATLWRAAEEDRLTPELRALGAASALSLLAIDVRYVATRRIRPVYLLDALAQAGILASWARSRVET